MVRLNNQNLGGLGLLSVALGKLARFVSSYAYGLKPSDFDAVFEVYPDGR